MVNKKCVLVVDEAQPIGLIANATAVLGVSIGRHVDGIVGPAVTDQSGLRHAGIVSIPLPVLKASRDDLLKIREKARGESGVQVFDFSDKAQRSKTYEEYTQVLAATHSAELTYVALALEGERKAVERLTGNLKTLR